MLEQTAAPPDSRSGHPVRRGDLAIVQFPHPRGEHRPDAGDWYEWNTGTHGRKFMLSPGRWLSAPEGSAGETGDVVFWGEWESVSRAVKRYPAGGAGVPRYLVEPLWTQPSSSGFLQNTDPYVFGEAFRYSNCRQNTSAGNPKAMQRLAVGSLVLLAPRSVDASSSTPHL